MKTILLPLVILLFGLVACKKDDCRTEKPPAQDARIYGDVNYSNADSTLVILIEHWEFSSSGTSSGSTNIDSVMVDNGKYELSASLQVDYVDKYECFTTAATDNQSNKYEYSLMLIKEDSILEESKKIVIADLSENDDVKINFPE